MITLNGKNNFRGTFDWHEWSAPIYETPEEAVAAFNTLGLKGKTISRISAIGYAKNIDPLYTNSYLFDKLEKAGMPINEICTERYPHRDSIPIPCKASLCEPVQIIFTDGTSFEFLPMQHGGARFACNSIPVNMVDGLNHSNFDANALFGDGTLDARIREFSITAEKSSKTNYTDYSIKGNAPYTTERTTYHYELSFNNYRELCFQRKNGSWFDIELCDSICCESIPFSKFQNAYKTTKYIPIVAGRDGGGSFWIAPTNRNEISSRNKPSERLFNNHGISIEDNYVLEFLIEFLLSYYDKALHQSQNEFTGKFFDQCGINLYTFDSMRGMLGDIRETALLLKADYDNPKLDDIKSHFQLMTFAGYNSGISPSEKQHGKIIRKNIWIAIDFYNRFANRMETMLNTSVDCDLIAFTAP